MSWEVKSMKTYVILAALVLGLFGGLSPAFGEVMVGDNVTFLAFGIEGGSGLETGTVLDVSEDGDWLLIYIPPDGLTVVSRWFMYSDETMANQLLTNLLSSVETYESTDETYEPTVGDYEANNEEDNLEEPVAQQSASYTLWPGEQRANEDQQLWRPNTVPKIGMGKSE